ncbi:MAG: YciK family oxidoreductase [Acidiferrobacteraceae bacterium]
MPPYQPRPDLLAGRVILVTGAGDGLGRAAALAFARHGATLILLGRTVTKLEQVYDEIESAGGATPAIMPLDLATASSAQYQELQNGVETEFGRLDGVLHSAAKLGPLTPLAMYDFDEWHKVMQVNVHAPYIVTRLLLPLLERSGDASVIFTSSEFGRRGRAYWGAFGISQFALEGMSQIWADETEGAGSVRFNTLDPGAVRTHMRLGAYPAEDQETLSAPEDVMSAYLYLMGPDSRGTTGQALSASDWTPGTG